MRCPLHYRNFAILLSIIYSYIIWWTVTRKKNTQNTFLIRGLEAAKIQPDVHLTFCILLGWNVCYVMWNPCLRLRHQKNTITIGKPYFPKANQTKRFRLPFCRIIVRVHRWYIDLWIADIKLCTSSHPNFAKWEFYSNFDCFVASFPNEAF